MRRSRGTRIRSGTKAGEVKMWSIRAKGCVELKVGTHPDNLTAQGYYLAQGFERQQVVGERFRLSL